MIRSLLGTGQQTGALGPSGQRDRGTHGRVAENLDKLATFELGDQLNFATLRLKTIASDTLLR
jgi:hypothetical protein